MEWKGKNPNLDIMVRREKEEEMKGEKRESLRPKFSGPFFSAPTSLTLLLSLNFQLSSFFLLSLVSGARVLLLATEALFIVRS